MGYNQNQSNSLEVSEDNLNWKERFLPCKNCGKKTIVSAIWQFTFEVNMMGDINEKKIDISDKIIKRLQNDKETLLEKIEGQEILLNLLYDDMEKKNKDIEDLKKQVVEGVACEERTEFERKKKTICNFM